MRERESAAVWAAAGSVAGERVVDLGCGAGAYAGEAKALGASRVVGVDRVEEMVLALPSGVAGVVGDVEGFISTERFDLVLLLGVLEFLPNPRDALRAAREACAPGGRLVALAPPEGLWGAGYRAYHRSHGVDVRLFSAATMAASAAAAGWVDLAITPVWPTALVLRGRPCAS